MIDAGMALFLRDGLRGATMEAIAKHAGVAKATLYAYFPDKEAVFAAVVGRLVEELEAIVERELSGEGAPWTRVAAALSAKHRFVYRLLEDSPHASELYEAGSPGNLPELARFDREFEERIVAILREAGYEDAERVAVLLGACAEGIARKAENAGQIGPAVRLVAERLLA
ncbi:MAG: TetR/AcrR family transcriptional regulator [Salaquimonas sp.]|nr:TetR/AcrR family transcriptional regulator [Salaquimonas sp.]